MGPRRALRGSKRWTTAERPLPGARAGDLRTEGPDNQRQGGLRPGFGEAHGGSTEITPPRDAARPDGGNLGVERPAAAAKDQGRRADPYQKPARRPCPIPGWGSGVQSRARCSRDRYQPPCRPFHSGGTTPSTAADLASARPATRANSVSYERYRWRPMATTESINPNYQIITNETGRVFRVGEEPRQILGYSRGVVIMAAWFVMCLAGLLEYTWGTVSGSLQAAHHWSIGQTFWAFSFFVIFESFVQIFTGYLRNRGILDVRWATIIGGIICGIVGYGLLAESNSIWQAYLGYAVLGGIGSGMVYSSAINIVAKWYPEKKGWRTGFVNGGWAYGAVPFIIVIGGINGAAINMTPSQIKNYILVQGIIMTVGIAIAGWFLKDPPKNW